MQTLSDYKLYTLTGLFFSHMVTFRVQPLFNKHQLHFFLPSLYLSLKKHCIKYHTVGLILRIWIFGTSLVFIYEYI